MTTISGAKGSPESMQSLDHAPASRPIALPDKVALEGLEEKWIAYWDENATHHFDRTAEREDVYSIDTPPPTVSGSLHVGHVFNFTQIDVLARYWRMRGKAVFFPIGWDDNGLPTERRVQNFFGVRCDPSLPYDPGFSPPATPPERPVSISRRNFVELCGQLTESDEESFEDLFRRIALSVDWSLKYTTISPEAQRVSQRGFLRMLEAGHAYRHEAPTLWDVDYSSAIAQAELEDREIAGAYHRLQFPRADGAGVVEIETTRPELLPSCVALVAHPDDARYQPLFGTNVRTPLFDVEVPVLAHELADPEKGSGIAMICTFGDLTDVIWWRELSLPVRTVIGRNGRFETVNFGDSAFPSASPEKATEAYAELEGKTVRQAQRRIIELLSESGLIVGEPRPIMHAVKFYERGERPLEIVSSSQWYVRTMPLRDELLAAGRELKWHPAFMRARFESWVEGLNGDWNISRQRYFGVPFPLWYPLDENGDIGLVPILPEESSLPIDPSSDVPGGYEESQRNQPGGFVGDPDVMDTWATSSLTPEIAGRYVDDPRLFARIFPMDLRPQAHEIIRTWLFSTVVRAKLAHDSLPWTNAAISGWILDPDGKKMSKSKGNLVVPNDLLDKYGTDAVRYWATSARLGVDTVLDEQQMSIGRRLAIKLLNATKFALSRVGDGGEESDNAAELAPLDASMLACLAEVVEVATSAFADYEHARALDRIEAFFWTFCDDYVELVKTRAYGTGDGAASARRALDLALSVQLRLFAPYLPFAAEETWSWWHDGSIHATSWPSTSEIPEQSGSSIELLDAAATVLGEVRHAKTIAKVSMRAKVARVLVRGPNSMLELVAQAHGDLCDAGSIEELELIADDTIEKLAVEAELAPIDDAGAK
ncbi:MAG TPA: valine--tRNA ligase [Acidimicrobiales bacterium]